MKSSMDVNILYFRAENVLAEQTQCAYRLQGCIMFHYCEAGFTVC